MVCAEAVSANKPSAPTQFNPTKIDFIDKSFLTQEIMSKFTGVAEPELEFAGAAVVLVVVNGYAILKAQRTEVGNVYVQADAPVVIKISRERVRPRTDGTGIVEQGHAHTGAIIRFKKWAGCIPPSRTRSCRRQPAHQVSQRDCPDSKTGHAARCLRYLKPRSE